MSDHPNVLVVLTDQQRWDTVGAYGSPMDLTPNLDAAAERGTRIESAISSQPVCGPTRACLQTGQHGTTHGVWRNTRELPHDGPLLARAFNEAGYDTGYVGKWHLGPTKIEPVPEGHRGEYEDFWRSADALEHTSHPYEGLLFDGDGERVEFDGYRVDALTDMALEFIEQSRENPFFCFLSYLEPHHQNDMETYVAPDGYAHQYRNPWVPEDLQGRPGDWFEELPDYYGICRRIDECLGRIFDRLDAAGMGDDTIVLFTSDHGSHFCTRNREYKRSCHESSVRVPAVLTGPGFDDGGVVNEPRSLLDLPPTLCEAAGVGVPKGMEGEVIDPEEPERDHDGVFIQISEAEVGRALRTDRWKYSVYAPDKAGSRDKDSERYQERYLYDLAADPYESVNLIGNGDYQDVADDLRERLTARIEAVEETSVTIEPAQYRA